MAESNADAPKPAATRKPRAAKASAAPEPAKARFAKAIEEAKAGTQALAREAQEAAEAYRDKALATGTEMLGKANAASADLRGTLLDRAEAYRDKASAQSGEWLDEAKALGEQAMERATELANEGKARTSGALASLGKIVADNAGTIDEKVGEKYGDYARQAARSLEETAAKIDAKDLGELGEDAKEFVRKSPGVAIGMAAAAGFLIARMVKKADD